MLETMMALMAMMAAPREALTEDWLENRSAGCWKDCFQYCSKG